MQLWQNIIGFCLDSVVRPMLGWLGYVYSYIFA